MTRTHTSRWSLAGGFAVAAVAAIMAGPIGGDAVGAVAAGPPAGGGDAMGGPAKAAAPPARATGPAAAMPLYFVANRGQTDRRARYYLQGRHASVFFARRGLAFSLTDRRGGGRTWGLELDFVGARRGVRPRALGRTAATVSYFKGRPRDFQTGVETYSRVAYRDLWPGIDLLYSGATGRLKYRFLVRPGASPEAIRLAWRGATGLRTNRRGQLEVSTPARMVRDDAPRSYQRIGGRRVKVASSYAVGEGHSYGFRLGRYDRSRPLVIDPAVLVYSGYIGGSGDEAANNVALDRRRNLYVIGTTTSSDFPSTVGPDRSFNDRSGLDDAFVAKVSRSGKRLVYAGYIGGSKRDTAINLAVDRAGAAYVSGSTSSSQADGFPALVGPDTTYNGGPQDAWIAKVRPDGRSLAYAGFIGGAGPGDPGGNNEQANGLAVDRAGRAFVGGFTSSDQSTFPDGDGFGSLRGFDRSIGAAFPGLLDAFVVKLNPRGSGLDYATYIGGGGADAGTGLVVDAGGHAYVNVFTGSSPAAGLFGGFPVTRGAFDTTFNGDPMSPAPNDAAVVKLNAAGTALDYSTYIGGAGEEQPFGSAVDRRGRLYLTGRTTSDRRTFPDGDGFGRVPGFDQVLNAGRNGSDPAEDTFVARLSRSGSGLGYATYLGGAGSDQAVALDVDRQGRAHVFGTTSSKQRTFPVTNGPDPTFNGGPTDAFVAQLDPAGTALGYAGYVGGAGSETGIGIVVDGTGNAYAAGSTDSPQRSFPVVLGPDRSKNGGFGSTDAFVTKIGQAAPVIRRLRIVAARAVTVRYRLSVDAVVRFAIERRSARGRSARRYVRVAGFTQRGRRGANRRRFPARRLRAGRYRVTAVATDPAGNRSRRRRAGFAVVRR